jgi:hypothetical protein
MIRPEQIPYEVVEAFVDAYYTKDMTRKAAIAAALNAWPGAHERTDDWCTPPEHNLILPLTQENNND